MASFSLSVKYISSPLPPSFLCSTNTRKTWRGSRSLRLWGCQRGPRREGRSTFLFLWSINNLCSPYFARKGKKNLIENSVSTLFLVSVWPCTQGERRHVLRHVSPRGQGVLQVQGDIRSCRQATDKVGILWRWLHYSNTTKMIVDEPLSPISVLPAGISWSGPTWARSSMWQSRRARLSPSRPLHLALRWVQKRFSFCVKIIR